MKHTDARARESASPADCTPLSAIMSRSVFCAPEQMALRELSRTFLESGISGAPVVDEGGCPVGVISKTDLVRFAFEQEQRDGDKRTKEVPAVAPRPASQPTVRDIMTPVAYALTPDVSIAHAAALMAFEGIHRLPIVAKPGGKLIGLLASSDVLRWIGEQNGYLAQGAAVA